MAACSGDPNESSPVDTASDSTTTAQTASGLEAYCQAAVPCGVSLATTVAACVTEEEAAIWDSTSSSECAEATIAFRECLGLHETCGDDGSGDRVFGVSDACSGALSEMSATCINASSNPPTDPAEDEPATEMGTIEFLPDESACAFTARCFALVRELEPGYEGYCEASLAEEHEDTLNCQSTYDAHVACLRINATCTAWSDSSTDIDHGGACDDTADAYRDCY